MSRLAGLLVALSVLASVMLAFAGRAQAQQFESCQANDAIAPDTIIQACSGAIKSGRFGRSDLAVAYLRRGLAYQRQKNYDRALADYGWIVKNDPKSQFGHAYAANASWLKGDRNRAMETAEAGLRINPQNPFLHYTRGMINAGRGSAQEAISDYTRAIELKPDFALALLHRADAYSNVDQMDRSCADVETAIKIDSRNGLAFAARSGCMLERRDAEQALTSANVAIAMQPNNAIGYYARGRAYRAKQEFDKAVSDFDMALQLSPNMPGALVNRGSIRRAQGQHDKAIEDFTTLLRINPAVTVAYAERGLAYIAKGDVEIGRKDLQAAVDSPARNAIDRRAQESARNQLALLSPAGATSTSSPRPRPLPLPRPAAPEQAAEPTAATGKRVALVIGNGQYANAVSLPNPSKDAVAIGDALRDLGFDVIQGIDLGRSAMEQNLRDFLQRAASARIALVFYAGHGMQVDGQNYLLPIDAKLAARTDLEFDTISLDKIIAALDDDVRANIIVLDACRDNPLAARFAAQARNRSVAAGGLAAYSSVGTGTLIAFATAPGQVAQDGDGDNSPFTTALLKHIKNSDLEVRQMMTRVRAEVAATTGRKQIPWDNSSLLGDIYLARRN